MSDFWTEEDNAHMKQLNSEGKIEELREYVAKKMFEARPLEFGPYFVPDVDDPMPYAEMSTLPVEEAMEHFSAWTKRTTIREWDKLSEDQKEDVYWQISFIVNRIEKERGQET